MAFAKYTRKDFLIQALQLFFPLLVAAVATLAFRCLIHEFTAIYSCRARVRSLLYVDKQIDVCVWIFTLEIVKRKAFKVMSCV